MPEIPKELNTFEALMQIVDSLRGPDGCPWDKSQTHKTLASFALEETHEFLETIELMNDAKMKDELGDVLFQVVLHATLAKERGAFSFADIFQNICEKLIRRHPHVFADVKVTSAQDVIDNWEKIKKKEKELLQSNTETKYSLPPEPFDFPNSLPSLQRAYKIGHKTSKLRFDWDNDDQVFAKVEEEIQEVKHEIANGSKDKIQEEFGDLLFAVSQWGRHLGIEPEQALRQANRKFEDRFKKMALLVHSENLNWEHLNLEEKEELWSRIKKKPIDN